MNANKNVVIVRHGYSLGARGGSEIGRRTGGSRRSRRERHEAACKVTAAITEFLADHAEASAVKTRFQALGQFFREREATSGEDAAVIVKEQSFGRATLIGLALGVFLVLDSDGEDLDSA